MTSNKAVADILPPLCVISFRCLGRKGLHMVFAMHGTDLELNYRKPGSPTVAREETALPIAINICVFLTIFYKQRRNYCFKHGVYYAILILQMWWHT
jgi:hypothetical protein